MPDISRIIDLDESTTVTTGNYVLLDSSSGGFRKIRADKLGKPDPVLIEKSITANGAYTANEETEDFSEYVYRNPLPYTDILPLNDWFVIEIPSTYSMYDGFWGEVGVGGFSYYGWTDIANVATYTDGMNPTSATVYRSNGTSGEVLYLAKASDNSKLYFYQSAQSQTFSLHHIKVEGEKAVDGYSEVVVDVAGGSSGIKLEYLAYAKFEDEDPGIDGFIFPLDVKEYDGYSEYLSYNSTNKCFTVLKDFTAILVPWIINYKTGAHEAQFAIKLNNDYMLNTIKSRTVSVDSPGSITSHTNFTTVPSELDGIYISLHINDTLSLVKPRDYGWSHVYLKIYKLFNSTNKSDNFMSSVINLSDTSTYQSVIVGDSDLIVYNADDLQIATSEGQYITNNFDVSLEAGESYIGALKDSSYSLFQNVPIFFQRGSGTQTISQIPLAQGVATLTITDTTASLSDYSGDWRNVWLRLSKVLPGQTY